MARIRTVKPDYWGDPKTARLSLPARLLFIGLLTEADDEGRFLASGKKLAGSLFPNDEDVTPKKVLGWLDELEAVGFVARYSSDGVEYAHIPAFTVHQKISHPTPSRLPNPSGEIPETFVPDLEQGTGNREVEHEASAWTHGEYKDALIDAWQLNPAELSTNEWGRVEKAASELCKIQADPSEISARRSMHKVLWPNVTATMLSVVGRWAECNPDPARLEPTPGRQTSTVLRAIARAT